MFPEKYMRAEAFMEDFRGRFDNMMRIIMIEDFGCLFFE